MKDYWSNKEILEQSYDALMREIKRKGRTFSDIKYYTYYLFWMTLNNLHARNLNIRGYFGWGNWHDYYMHKNFFYYDLWEDNF